MGVTCFTEAIKAYRRAKERIYTQEGRYDEQNDGYLSGKQIAK
jgi:hypothetical protein